MSRDGSHRAADRYALTERQREVLALMADGHTNFEIAQQLGLTLEGAKYHVSEVLGKLGVDSREQAIAVAHQRGWSWPRLPRMRVLAPLGVLGVLAAGVVVALLLLPGASTKGRDHVWIALIHTSAPDGSSNLEVIDGTTGARRTLGKQGFQYGSAEWSPDGSRLASLVLDPSNSGNQATIRLFKADDDWSETDVTTGRQNVRVVAWSPNGRYFLLGGAQTSLYDRDGNLLYISSEIPPAAPASFSGGGFIWSSDSRRAMAEINEHVVTLDVDSGLTVLDPPAGVDAATLSFVGWKDDHTAIAIENKFDLAHPNPPPAWAVDLGVSPPSWSKATPDQALDQHPGVSATSLSLASAASPEDTLRPMRMTADERGIVFSELHRVRSTGEALYDAVIVYINGASTRITLPPDLASVQPGRFAVVLGPAR